MKLSRRTALASLAPLPAHAMWQLWLPSDMERFVAEADATADSVLAQMGDSTFRECSSLVSVEIGHQVTGQIGTFALYGCSSLASVTIGSSVTGVSDSFWGLTNAVEKVCRSMSASGAIARASQVAYPACWAHASKNASGHAVVVPPANVANWDLSLIHI